MAKPTLASVTALINEQTSTLMKEIESLRGEVLSLKKELAAVKEQSALHQSALQQNSSDETSNSQWTLADVVKTSVKSALGDEKTKNDVIISAMPENSKDQEDVEVLCNRVQAVTEPCAVTRLGKSKANSDHPRLIKATFPSQFDARAFLARVDEKQKKGDQTISKIRARPGRTRDEQARHLKLSKRVYQMNQEAKEAELNESYSLRRNGEVWKFTKTESGQWKKVPDWSFSPDISDSGNEMQLPKSPHQQTAPQEQRR